MQYLQPIADALNQVPPAFWPLAVQTVISAVIVSPLALTIKKWWKIEGEKVMMFIVILGSIVTAVIAYLQDDPKYGPWLVAVQGGLTFATTQPVYYLFVKPLYSGLASWFASQVAQAAQLNDVKSAAVPASGLPIGDNTKQI